MYSLDGLPLPEERLDPELAGYGLTAPMMRWFFDHYADPGVRR